MTNWKIYKITGKSDYTTYVTFWLDGCVIYSNRTDFNIIDCVNTFPFRDWQEGDYIEIDIDRTRYYEYNYHKFNDNNIIKKVYSSEIVPRNNVNLSSVTQNQVSTIVQQINSAIDNDERNEYEARIHVDPNSGKYSGFSIIGRRK